MPADAAEALRIPLADEAATNALGAALADLCRAGFDATPRGGFAGFTIHLSGDLGAGKTTVARAFLRRLGVGGSIKSPTYTLIEPYVVEMPHLVEPRQNVKLNCYHFDFYRFENPREWSDAGFRDEFSDAALRLVEWPERAVGGDGAILPAPDLVLVLAHDGAGRVATLSPGTPQGAAWLSASPLAPTAAAAGGAPSAASPPASRPS